MTRVVDSAASRCGGSPPGVLSWWRLTANAIERYQPQMRASVWCRIGPECRRAVAKAHPATVQQAREWLGALSHAATCADAHKRPARAEQVLTVEAVEWYLAIDWTQSGERLRGKRRRQLTELREAMSAPACHALLLASGCPYTPAQENQL